MRLVGRNLGRVWGNVHEELYFFLGEDAKQSGLGP